MTNPKRVRRVELTPLQRRREIVEILAAGLARMPPAAAVAGKPVRSARFSRKRLPTCLEVPGD